MESRELEQSWRDGFGGVAASMAQWRQEHPRATLREIENALDERMAAIRTQMLVETALTSGAANFAGSPARLRPKCPECKEPLVSRGQRERALLTTQGQELRIQRDYGHCPSCGTELFPPG